MSQIFKLPFAEIQIHDDKSSIADFLTQYFFPITDHTPALFTLKISCKNVSAPDKSSKLETNCSADENHFYLADTRGKVVKLDFLTLTKDKWEIIVDPEFDPYFLYTFLIESVMIVVLLQHQVVFFHSSGVVDKQKRATIFPAWQNTGKTHLILQLTQQDFQFLGDDYCIVKDSEAYCYPKKLNLFSYNFEQLPRFKQMLPALQKTKMNMALQTKKSLEAISKKLSGGIAKSLFRISELAEVATNVQLSPQEFNVDISDSATLKQFVLLIRTDTNKVLKLEKAEYAEMVTITMLYEQREFFQLYQKYSFLFPEKKNSLIENFEPLYRKQVSSLFGKIPVDLQSVKTAEKNFL